MHNHNENKNHSMIWMMVPCFLLLGILFFGGGKLSSSGYLWPILIVVFIGAHFWMMFRGHRSHDHENISENKDVAPGQTNAEHDTHDEGKNHKSKPHGGCCH